MITKKQAELLRRTIDGVCFCDIDDAERDALRYLMEQGYCAADVRRDPDAILIAEKGKAILYEFDRLEKRRRLSFWRDVLLVLIGAIAAEGLHVLFSIL